MRPDRNYVVRETTAVLGEPTALRTVGRKIVSEPVSHHIAESKHHTDQHRQDDEEKYEEPDHLILV